MNNYRFIRSAMVAMLFGVSSQISLATVTNFFSLTKGNKKCVLVGENHDLNGNTVGIINSELFEKVIQQLVGSSKKILCLLELTPIGLDRIHTICRQGKKESLREEPLFYLGSIALENNFQLGSVTFKAADRRDNRVESGAIGALQGLVGYLLQEKNPLKVVLKKGEKYYTWDEYFEHIQQEKAILAKEIDELIAKTQASQEQIKAARDYAATLLKNFDICSEAGKKWLKAHSIPTTEIINVSMVQMHCKKRSEVEAAYYQFVLPITGVQGDAIFIVEALKGLQEYDELITFAGGNHMMRICDLFERLGFASESVGTREHSGYAASTKQNCWIAPDDLAAAFCKALGIKPVQLSQEAYFASQAMKAMDVIMQKRSNRSVVAKLPDQKVDGKQSVSTSNAQPTQAAIDVCSTRCGKQGVSLCGQCKQVWYCSKECQKADWKTHKIACKAAKT